MSVFNKIKEDLLKAPLPAWSVKIEVGQHVTPECSLSFITRTYTHPSQAYSITCVPVILQEPARAYISIPETDTKLTLTDRQQLFWLFQPPTPPALNMDKMTLIDLANDTLRILEAGEYYPSPGNRITIKNRIFASEMLTYVYGADQLSIPQLPTPRTERPTIEITTEGTVEALQRFASLYGPCGDLGCLNFASARTPGGGFLRGTMAQEESLAYSSSLYKSLLKADAYYAANKAKLDDGDPGLYTDMLVLSLDVQFFRDGRFNLLDEPFPATVITSPAPNARNILKTHPETASQIKETFANRMDLVFRLAITDGLKNFVLGAWGCGVFGNDPQMVAELFKINLEKYGSYFDHIVFAIAGGGPNYDTFKRVLEPTA